jgi:hypothetical protein
LPNLDPAGVTRPVRRQGELGDLQPVLSLGRERRPGKELSHATPLTFLNCSLSRQRDAAGGEISSPSVQIDVTFTVDVPHTDE